MRLDFILPSLELRGRCLFLPPSPRFSGSLQCPLFLLVGPPCWGGTFPLAPRAMCSAPSHGGRGAHFPISPLAAGATGPMPSQPLLVTATRQVTAPRPPSCCQPRPEITLRILGFGFGVSCYLFPVPISESIISDRPPHLVPLITKRHSWLSPRCPWWARLGLRPRVPTAIPRGSLWPSPPRLPGYSRRRRKCLSTQRGMGTQRSPR